MMILQFASAVFKSMRMQMAWNPEPSMHETLLYRRVLVPPKSLGESRIMMFLLEPAAKITISISIF
jgi:hypothetical protein